MAGEPGNGILAVSVRQASKLLGTSMDYIKRMVDDGRLTMTVIGPRKTMILRSSIDKLLADGIVKPGEGFRVTISSDETNPDKVAAKVKSTIEAAIKRSEQQHAK